MTDKTEEYRLLRECYRSGQMSDHQLDQHFKCDREFADWWGAQDTPTSVPIEGATMLCPCTTFEQDEDCPIGQPSLLCSACGGKGVASTDTVVALAAEMIKIADQVDELEDPFAAWESVSLLQTENERLRAAIAVPAPGAVPSDVAALVVAARIVAYEDQGPEALRDLDRAAEVFAERVPWDNEPISDGAIYAAASRNNVPDHVVAESLAALVADAAPEAVKDDESLWRFWNDKAREQAKTIDTLRERLEVGPCGEDAIDVAESAIGLLRYRIDVLERALRLVVSYDDLLRGFEGHAEETLFAGDVPVIDAAYDEMAAAARAALNAEGK